MTDITELAQSLKAAAEKATPGRIGDRIDGSGSIKYQCFGNDGSLVLQTDHKNMEYGFIGPNAEADELFFRECAPGNILALVEALEKAKGMEAYWKTQCRGITDHCEVLQARIAELEPRTVKLPAERFCPAEYAGSQLWSETEVWNKAITACADALRADGIKVEVE